MRWSRNTEMTLSQNRETNDLLEEQDCIRCFIFILYKNLKNIVGDKKLNF